MKYSGLLPNLENFVITDHFYCLLSRKHLSDTLLTFPDFNKTSQEASKELTEQISKNRQNGAVQIRLLLLPFKLQSLFFFDCTACRILVPQPGMEPDPCSGTKGLQGRLSPGKSTLLPQELEVATLRTVCYLHSYGKRVVFMWWTWHDLITQLHGTFSHMVY